MRFTDIIESFYDVEVFPGIWRMSSLKLHRASRLISKKRRYTLNDNGNFSENIPPALSFRFSV
jgi:hypothetical protein